MKDTERALAMLEVRRMERPDLSSAVDSIKRDLDKRPWIIKELLDTFKSRFGEGRPCDEEGE